MGQDGWLLLLTCSCYRFQCLAFSDRNYLEWLDVKNSISHHKTSELIPQVRQAVNFQSHQAVAAKSSLLMELESSPALFLMAVFLIRAGMGLEQALSLISLYTQIYLTHLWCFLKILFIYFPREGKGGREERKETSVWEKHRSVASHTPPTGVLARNLGVGPDWGSNPSPFGSQSGAQHNLWYILVSYQKMVLNN